MKKKELTLRAIVGILYAGLIFVSNYTHSYVFAAVILIFFLLCYYELSKILQFKKPIWTIGSLFLTGLPVFVFSKSFFLHQPWPLDLSIQNLSAVVGFILSVVCLFKFSEELDLDQAKAIFMALYLGVPFGLAFSLVTVIDQGELISKEIFYLFVLLWTSDSFAYLFGNLWGKTPLAPSISSAKTIEGFLGGMFFVWVAGFLIEKWGPTLKGNWIYVSLIVGFAAPLGDLCESKLKRIFKIKDSSNLLPGHGGFLDRLDSFIFCIPFVFLYFLFA
ncbi:MAG: phosphatidate cytidylyltransferase [Flavobacteriaceae bacterium]|nr:MAG: phosphatidate cytidylyltransferase [Flavobacteriaceae bacterium]